MARTTVTVDTSAVDDVIAFFREHEETIYEHDEFQDRLDVIIAANKVAICINLAGDALRTEPSLQLIQLMADIERASRAPW